MEEKTTANYYSLNNFDIIRLLAALQVVVVHLITHFRLSSLDWIVKILSPFPGVPVFFFVSGLLISAAWERNPSLNKFFLNRFYRIYPGLWGCIIFAVLSVVILADTELISQNTGTFLLWIFAQSTILQMWNPEFLKGYGLGAVNGALWTIAVEICFYLFVPILYWIYRIVKIRRIIILLIITSLSFSLNYFLEYGLDRELKDCIAIKAILLTPFPWVGMFCVGIFANNNLNYLVSILSGRFLPVLCVFMLFAIVPFFVPRNIFFGFGNHIGLVNYFLLCALILSGAFTNKTLATSLLKKHDLSYGIYIYHQPLLNVFLVLGFVSMSGLILCLMFVILLAFISWKFIERPVLNLKKSSLHKR